MPNAAPRQLSSEEFYAGPYLGIRDWINEFAHAHHRGRKSSPPARTESLLVMSRCDRRIFDETLVVIGGEPVPAAGDEPRACLESAARLPAALAGGDGTQRADGDKLAVRLEDFHDHVPDALIDSVAEAEDVVNFVSKVPSGGIVVYDDIHWPSTAAGLEILRDTCRLLHVVTAFGSDTEPGCAAFVKV